MNTQGRPIPMFIRFFAPLLLATSPMLTGCSQLRIEANQFWTHLQDQSTQAKQQPAQQQPAQANETRKPERTAADIHQIIRLLENGQFQAGHDELSAYLQRHPNDATARSLNHQIEVDPVVTLGPPKRHYTVQPGDTLGGLAAKYLGSPLKFLILARYNHIKRSKDLRVGQVIDLPARKPDEGSDASKPAEPSARDTQAAGSPHPSTSPSKASTKAKPVPEATTPPTIPPKASLLGKRENAALKQQEIGLNALNKHYNAVAYQAFKRALAIDPTLQPAKQETKRLGPKLVRQYHEEALAAYRDQKLNRAIALWNKALAIDPNYEPALGYRARALELEHRLKQLEQK